MTDPIVTALNDLDQGIVEAGRKYIAGDRTAMLAELEDTRIALLDLLADLRRASEQEHES